MSALFTHSSFDNHENVVYCHHAPSGLKAIIAVHSTVLGPALGGTRLWNYTSEEEALNDVLRLSKGMTYKNAVAGLNLGGGKAVIIGDPRQVKSKELFEAFGRFVDSLAGTYITAEDVNIREEDMAIIATQTRSFTGDGKGSGDPSPLTALGVFHGIRAALKHRQGSDNLSGVRVAVQGAGNVGSYLCEHLAAAGAELVVADIFAERAEALATKYGARVVSTETIHSTQVDVFAPCALGAGLNDQTIPQIKAGIIAGGANNQLADESKHMQQVIDAGILYAPDFVINAGGVINCYQELIGYDRQAAEEKAANIYETLLTIFDESENQSISTLASAYRLAEKRISAATSAHEARKGAQSLFNQGWYSRDR